MSPLSLAGALLALGVISPVAAAATGVSITQLDDRVRIEIDGQLFTEYRFKESPKPFFYPIIGPGESPMTRDFPMKETAGESHDHPHHRGLYYGHGSVNGVNFWADTPGIPGRTVLDGPIDVTSGETTGTIHLRDKLVTVDGKLVATDERTFRIHQTPYGPMLDFEITHFAANGDLVFNDTKEGSLAIRVAESMVLKYSEAPGKDRNREGRGRIVNSEGVRDGNTWGKRAKWVDYYGPVGDKTVGVAIFDHPGNPRYPSWWHVRDYGLFAVNPFGVHDFDRLENPAAGELKVPAGKSVTFRYRLFFHAGDEKAAHVAERYAEYAARK